MVVLAAVGLWAIRVLTVGPGGAPLVGLAAAVALVTVVTVAVAGAPRSLAAPVEEEGGG